MNSTGDNRSENITQGIEMKSLFRVSVSYIRWFLPLYSISIFILCVKKANVTYVRLTTKNTRDSPPSPLSKSNTFQLWWIYVVRIVKDEETNKGDATIPRKV